MVSTNQGTSDKTRMQSAGDLLQTGAIILSALERLCSQLPPQVWDQLNGEVKNAFRKAWAHARTIGVRLTPQFVLLGQYLSSDDPEDKSWNLASEGIRSLGRECNDLLHDIDSYLWMEPLGDTFYYQQISAAERELDERLFG